MPTLQQARLDHDLTQVDLAARSGLSVATIGRVERGVSRPTRQTIRRLSDALGTDARDIVEFRPRPRPRVRRAGVTARWSGMGAKTVSAQGIGEPADVPVGHQPSRRMDASPPIGDAPLPPPVDVGDENARPQSIS